MGPYDGHVLQVVEREGLVPPDGIAKAKALEAEIDTKLRLPMAIDHVLRGLGLLDKAAYAKVWDGVRALTPVKGLGPFMIDIGAGRDRAVLEKALGSGLIDAADRNRCLETQEGLAKLGVKATLSEILVHAGLVEFPAVRELVAQTKSGVFAAVPRSEAGDAAAKASPGPAAVVPVPPAAPPETGTDAPRRDSPPRPSSADLPRRSAEKPAGLSNLPLRRARAVVTLAGAFAAVLLVVAVILFAVANGAGDEAAAAARIASEREETRDGLRAQTADLDAQVGALRKEQDALRPKIEAFAAAFDAEKAKIKAELESGLRAGIEMSLREDFVGRISSQEKGAAEAKGELEKIAKEREAIQTKLKDVEREIEAMRRDGGDASSPGR